MPLPVTLESPEAEALLYYHEAPWGPAPGLVYNRGSQMFAGPVCGQVEQWDSLRSQGWGGGVVGCQS